MIYRFVHFNCQLIIFKISDLDEFRRQRLPENALESLCEKIGNHVDLIQLSEQLVDLHHTFSKPVKTLPEKYQSRIYVDNCNIIDNSEDSESEDSGSKSSDDWSEDAAVCTNTSCRSCFSCAFNSFMNMVSTHLRIPIYMQPISI